MSEKRCFGCMQLKQSAPICEHCGYDERRPNAPHQLPPGTILNNQYIVGKVLGQGGFGITYMGWDSLLQIPVAIKEYFPNTLVTRNSTVSTWVYLCNENYRDLFVRNRDRFAREARSLANLGAGGEMPNIVRVHNLIQANATAYIIMEYVKGTDLRSYIAKKGGRLTMEETLRLLQPIVESLEKLHAINIIHRDLSPDNIMVLPDGSTKLIDFGAAHEVRREQSTTSIVKHGFAPPEQYTRRGNLGPWTDVYAMSATVYYCLTGHVPPSVPDRQFDGEKIRWEGIDSRYREALEKGLELTIESRIQNMAQLRMALCTGTPVPSKPKSTFALTLAVIAFVIVVIWFSNGKKPEMPTISQPSSYDRPAPAATEEPEPEITAATIPPTTAPTRPPETEPPVITERFSYLGGVYEGQVEDGVPHGEGVLTWEDCSYSGTFLDGYPSGSGTAKVPTSDGIRQLEQDNWDYIFSGKFSVNSNSVGSYTGLALVSSGFYTPCGWGELEFTCGGEYQGAFWDGIPNGAGSYRHSGGETLEGQWSWTEADSAVFHPDYPQSTMHYTGMLLNGSYAGFGIMEYDFAGTFTGEFIDGEVRGSGTYVYRMYNSQPSATGTNWAQKKNGNIDSTFTGTGLTLNGNLQGYGMSRNKNSGQYYIGEVEYGKRGGYGRFFSSSGSEYTNNRGLYKGGMFLRLA